MNFNSLLADVVSRLNTGNRHRVRTVALNYNKITLDLVFLLLELGLIRGVKMRPKNIIWVNLRFKGGFHIFYKITLISKPSRRVFWSMRNLFLQVDKNNNNIFIVSTTQGLVLGSECIWRTLTGEVLIKIML